MKSIKNTINKLRSKYGRKNGVIDGLLLDHPVYEMQDAKNKKNYNRVKSKAVEGE
jgi:hypothetical protein